MSSNNTNNKDYLRVICCGGACRSVPHSHTTTPRLSVHQADSYQSQNDSLGYESHVDTSLFIHATIQPLVTKRMQSCFCNPYSFFCLRAGFCDGRGEREVAGVSEAEVEISGSWGFGFFVNSGLVWMGRWIGCCADDNSQNH